jgi:hypothetical protein
MLAADLPMAALLAPEDLKPCDQYRDHHAPTRHRYVSSVAAERAGECNRALGAVCLGLRCPAPYDTENLSDKLSAGLAR